MSAVTLREVLTLPALRGAYVFAGEAGLDRVVSGVNVMEVPDIEAYVKAGELLLTTGYPVRERPERLVELLPVLAASGLAGLAINLERYLGVLPDDLAAEAKRLAFPVVLLPHPTSFNEIIGAVLAVVLAEYGAEPEGAEAIRERLTGVALAGGGLEEIARTLEATLERDVTILDREGVVLGRGGHSAHPTTDEAAGQVGLAPWVFPITVGGLLRGRILVGGAGEPTLGQRRLIRQSCFAAGMHIAQALAGLELDRRLRVLFLEELVTGHHIDEPTLQQRSRLFGWDLSGEHMVVLARCDAELPESGLISAARHRLPAGSLTWSRGQEVVAIVRASLLRPARNAGPTGGGPAETADRWRGALLGLGAGSATVAVGSLARSPGELAASHVTAREALRIAAATGLDVVNHEDLRLERLFLAVPEDMLRNFVDSEIGALAAHDEDTGSDLCATLAAYLGVGNGAETARQMFVHYNTVKHRLSRIAELTGADLHEPRTRLRLHLALAVRTLL